MLRPRILAASIAIAITNAAAAQPDTQQLAIPTGYDLVFTAIEPY